MKSSTKVPKKDRELSKMMAMADINGNGNNNYNGDSFSGSGDQYGMTDSSQDHTGAGMIGSQDQAVMLPKKAAKAKAVKAS